MKYFDQILDAQDLCDGTTENCGGGTEKTCTCAKKRIFRSMLFARPLFPTKSRKDGLGDNWEVFANIKGEGGTGKSTCVSMLETIVGSDNVGHMESDMSRGHSFQEFCRDDGTPYKIVIASDYDDPNWNQETLQKVCSGESIAVNLKNKHSLILPKSPHLIGVTNGQLNYKNESNQMSRRIYCEYFRNSLKSKG